MRAVGVELWRTVPQPASSSVLLIAGLACLFAAVLLLPGPVTTLRLLIALGVGFSLISLHIRLGKPPYFGSDGVHGSGARIERRLEQLQDVRWELSENETRYRALLDTQDEAIVRRDEAGNLTFANKAFLDMFAAKGDSVLGRPFVIDVSEESATRPKFMAIAVHPYITGQPFRIKYLASVYDYIAQFGGVLHWNGEQILEWYTAARVRPD